MLTNSVKNLTSKLFRKIPLRTVIIVPFVIQIFAVVGLTGWLSFRNGQKAVDDLSAQLRSEITTRIDQHLQTHTTMPHRANQLNVDTILQGRLKLDDTNALERHLWKQIQQFDTVSYVGIGTEKATYVGAHRFDNDSIRLEVLDETTGSHLQIWDTDNLANRTERRNTLPNYDPRNRPWYASAVKAEKPVWSKAYFSSRRSTLSVNQPIYDPKGQLLAVATADISVLKISQFLRSLKIGQTGQAFIIERSGLLVATSTSEKPYRLIQGDNISEVHRLGSQHLTKAEQFEATESDDALTRSSAHSLIQHVADLNSIQNRQQLDFTDNGSRYFLQVEPFKDEWGLD